MRKDQDGAESFSGNVHSYTHRWRSMSFDSLERLITGFLVISPKRKWDNRSAILNVSCKFLYNSHESNKQQSSRSVEQWIFEMVCPFWSPYWFMIAILFFRRSNIARFLLTSHSSKVRVNVIFNNQIQLYPRLSYSIKVFLINCFGYKLQSENYYFLFLHHSENWVFL